MESRAKWVEGVRAKCLQRTGQTFAALVRKSCSGRRGRCLQRTLLRQWEVVDSASYFLAAQSGLFANAQAVKKALGGVVFQT